MRVHLVDGTYELFRYHFGPANKDPDRGATRGVLGSCLLLLEQGATHVGVATDHVIESFRNDLWPTYKDGSGVDPALKAQFPVVEAALAAAGFTVWPMVEVEADDALAAAAEVAAADARVGRLQVAVQMADGAPPGIPCLPYLPALGFAAVDNDKPVVRCEKAEGPRQRGVAQLDLQRVNDQMTRRTSRAANGKKAAPPSEDRVRPETAP